MMWNDGGGLFLRSKKRKGKKEYAIVTSGVLVVHWISKLSDKQPMNTSEPLVTRETKTRFL